MEFSLNLLVELNYFLRRYLLDFKTQYLIYQNYPIEFKYKLLLNIEKLFLPLFDLNSFRNTSSNSTCGKVLKFNRAELEESGYNCT